MATQLFTLGLPRVEAGGNELASFQRHKLRLALLSFVGIERAVSRERTVGVFWPDRSPDAARHALSQALYEIRQDLSEDPFAAEGDRIQVSGDLWVDAAAFEAAVEGKVSDDACALYRGAFLEGVYLWRTREWEQWVDVQRARLGRLHRRARRMQLEELDATGGVEHALAAARSWAELEPLDDEAQHRVIELLVRTGQRTEALRHYDVYAQRLLEELEVEPLDETKELIELLRAGTSHGPVDADRRTAAPGKATVKPGSATLPSDVSERPIDAAGQLGHSDHWPHPGLREDVGPQWEVVRLVGEGGMAAVYAVREVSLGRLVALKVLADDLVGQETARRRFEREAEAAARIHHPNVLAVYGVGHTRSGRPYIVMPYVKGGSLADRLQAWGPLDVDEALAMVSEIASGLAAAHRLGIVHRDVRPANVLYQQDSGRCLLCDFGIAAVLDELMPNALRLTRTGERIGNPACVSPEQLLGMPVTAKADVYALGTLAFELLTGRSPLDARTPAELIVAHARAEPQRVNRFRPDVPDAVVDLIDRCLAKRPEHRPGIDEILAAIS
jgi:DNA-binding SARP family transcriptional activator